MLKRINNLEPEKIHCISTVSVFAYIYKAQIRDFDVQGFGLQRDEKNLALVVLRLRVCVQLLWIEMFNFPQNFRNLALLNGF